MYWRKEYFYSEIACAKQCCSTYISNRESWDITWVKRDCASEVCLEQVSCIMMYVYAATLVGVW